MTYCETKYWGALEYPEDSAIEFPAGIPGFERERQFVLIEQKELDPLVFLQSLATPCLCFPALHVRVVCPDYQLRISAEEMELAGFANGRQPPIGGELACLALVHIDENEITANLLAPIVINIAARRAVQAILAGTDYSHQHRIDLVEAPVCS
jgi:flagellar assembly factor FliW